MKEIGKELSKLVNDHFEKYHELTDNLTSINLSEDKWSLKEIIGHLIDSASNNHQRFVRLQIENVLTFPVYHYDWIKIEKFNKVKFIDLISLWKFINILIVHLIENVDESKLPNIWKREDKDITLKELMTDYLRHLKDHIKHFEERLNELKNGK
jgi:hypothetical protein